MPHDWTGHVPHDASLLPAGNIEEGKQRESCQYGYGPGCGHGECNKTGAWDPDVQRANETAAYMAEVEGKQTGPQRGGRAQAEAMTDYVGVARNNATAGQEVEVRLERDHPVSLPEVSQRAVESVRFPGVRWSPADLDRCEHGRHSIDSCFDCPRGKSIGNRFLVEPHLVQDHTRVTDQGLEIRIGTMVRGEPIWVTAVGRPRGEDNEH